MAYSRKGNLLNRVRQQADTYSCGVVAVQNALEAVGRRISEKEIRRHSGTTPEHGTTHLGLQNALERLGHEYEEVFTSFDAAYAKLHAHLQKGGAACISTQKDQHWEAAIGVLGQRVVIYGGQDIHTLLVLTKRQLRDHWTPSARKGRYGILVHPRG